MTNWIVDSGYLPNFALRYGARQQIRTRLSEINAASFESALQAKLAFLDELRACPIAVETDKANEQHTEIDPTFWKNCLGPRMKYSCSYYESCISTLGDAEVAMLELYVVRADIKDGMNIMDLG